MVCTFSSLVGRILHLGCLEGQRVHLPRRRLRVGHLLLPRRQPPGLRQRLQQRPRQQQRLEATLATHLGSLQPRFALCPYLQMSSIWYQLHC